MIIKAFKGFRPVQEKVRQVASRPYDVMTSAEAREEASGNPYSFLNVVKPEITLPKDIDAHSEAVYEAGKNNFQKLVDEGVFVQDTNERLYIYELILNGKSQTGIVAAASIDDYLTNKIKKHELTRPDKEADRKRHVHVSMLNAEPVFFAYPADASLTETIDQLKKTTPPLYDFIADDTITHRLWAVDDKATIDTIVNAFSNMPATYVADGHHRTAAAALVGEDLRRENKKHTGQEPYNFFMAVHFPDDQLTIMDYNRVVKDLNGRTPESFIAEVAQSFSVEPKGEAPYKPTGLHELAMYLDGTWYALKAKTGMYNNEDPIGILDVTILSKKILEPILNIHDLRTDNRIDFVGGMRGLAELTRRVDSGEMAVAFALYPVSMTQLMAIADSGGIMPPKTTWFEPKLRSGLVVYSLK